MSKLYPKPGIRQTAIQIGDSPRPWCTPNWGKLLVLVPRAARATVAVKTRIRLDSAAPTVLPAHSDDRSDAQLIAALNAGDLSAFDAIYYRYRDWVVRLAQRMTANPDDALDVLQETFAYLFRKFPGFVLSARMTTFLYPVVKNLSIAARRRRQRHATDAAIRLTSSKSGPDPVAPEPVHYDRQRQELSDVLRSLPEIQREVLLMRFVDDMSLLEIAEALGIREGTVKSRLHNAVATLRTDPRVREFFEK